MRILDKKIAYTDHAYSPEITEGILIAKALNEAKERVFKTLVTVSASYAHYVFYIPVASTLDFKKPLGWSVKNLLQ